MPGAMSVNATNAITITAAGQNTQRCTGGSERCGAAASVVVIAVSVDAVASGFSAPRLWASPDVVMIPR